MVVLRDDPRDGRLKRQRQSLRAAGYDVHTFAVLSDNEQHGWLSTITRPFAYRKRRWGVAAQLKRYNPHLVISHEPESLPVSGYYLSKAPRPHVYDAHEYYEGQRGVTDARKEWLAKTYNRYGQTVDALITVSPGMIELYKKTHAALPKGILIANAANAQDFDHYDGRLHREIGVPAATKILLYQGGMWEDRGVEDVIEASTLLPDGWVTVFMGYGPMKAHLPKHERVFVVDTKPQAELLNWTAGATLGVIPYPDNSLNHKHCLPNKLWEFPQAHVPLVARELHDLTDFIHSHKTGITYPVTGDGTDLADAITRLSAADYTRLKNNCRAFSKTENWQKYEKVYLGLVDRLINA